jgi:IclR family mhp operon transcriptional activator
MGAIKTVRAVQRGFQVLEALNRCHGATAQQLARAVRIPRPTVYRLLETMRMLGYVTRSDTDDCWHLTAHIKALSAGFHDDVWVTRTAAPLLHKLGQDVLWPIDLVTYENGAMIIRETTHAESPFSIDRGMAGTRLPVLRTSGGRAYLAYCPAAEREIILRSLRRSRHPHDQEAHDRAYIKTLLTQTRRAGYGSRTEGFNPHTSSISVPIIVNNRVHACITMIWIKSAMPLDEAVRHHLTAMQRTAAEISERMSVQPAL